MMYMIRAFTFMKGIRITTNSARLSSLYAQEVEAYADFLGNSGA